MPDSQPQLRPRPFYVSFKDMPVWQSAMAAAEQVLTLTDRLPRKEDYGFTSQIRRAALSVSANIAEAFGRNHSLDKIKFYYVARGSLTETQSHIEYGKRVGYIDPRSAPGTRWRVGDHSQPPQQGDCDFAKVHEVISTLASTSTFS